MKNPKRSKLGLIVVTVAMALVSSACGSEKVDEAHIGIHYSDGWIEGKKFEKIIEPGGTQFVWNDDVFQLPINQRSYIVSTKDDVGDRAGGDFLVTTTKDRIKLRFEMSTRFFLNTRPEVLKAFFPICQKYSCWTDEGWDEMLTENFRIPLESVSNTIGFGYESDYLRYSAGAWSEFSNDFGKQFTAEQTKLLGQGDFFCGPGYDRNKPETGCPSLPVSISGILFEEADLEAIPGKRKLAIDQKNLAEEQKQAEIARAGVQVAYANALKGAATPEVIALQQADAMNKCAANPQGCTLVVSINDDTTNVAVQPR